MRKLIAAALLALAACASPQQHRDVLTYALAPADASTALLSGDRLSVQRTVYEAPDGQDPLFDPPISTFELTMKVANVANVNTIPGEDVFYMDCRVLPQYETEEVLGTVRGVMKQVGAKYGLPIHLSLSQHEQAAPITDTDSRVVTMLSDGILHVIGVERRVGGIGGGTCAAFFRRKGFNAAVWAKIDEAAHQANEYTWIENLVAMTKVFALMMLRS